MTNPSEVVVTERHAIALLDLLNIKVEKGMVDLAKNALAVLIAARVPDTGWDDPFGAKDTDEVRGFKACRDRVLKGG